jgi:hypothetical protein
MLRRGQRGIRLRPRLHVTLSVSPDISYYDIYSTILPDRRHSGPGPIFLRNEANKSPIINKKTFWKLQIQAQNRGELSPAKPSYAPLW